MSVVYIGLGIYLLTAKNIFSFSSFQQCGFGIILIIYGLFRFYLTLKKKKESESDENDEE
jgi:cadmium resistance protein CadD (predicted permease)